MFVSLLLIFQFKCFLCRITSLDFLNWSSLQLCHPLSNYPFSFLLITLCSLKWSWLYATGLEKVSFHSQSQRRAMPTNVQTYHTVLLISKASNVMLNICQAKRQEISDAQAVFRKKGEEPESKLPMFLGSQRKQRDSRKTSSSFIVYTKAFDCVNHNKLCRLLREIRTLDHLTCVLRNLYASQEGTVGTRHGTTDMFQIENKSTTRLYIITLLI